MRKTETETETERECQRQNQGDKERERERMYVRVITQRNFRAHTIKASCTRSLRPHTLVAEGLIHTSSLRPHTLGA